MDVPSPPAPRGWRVGQMVAGGVIGAIIIYPAISAAVISGGMGHGHYTAARALFPVPMLLTLWTDNHISDLSIVLAFIQFPLYGVLVGATPPRKMWVTWSLILAVHLMAAFVCFSGYIPNFS